jgi:hypothetical protein
MSCLTLWSRGSRDCSVWKRAGTLNNVCLTVGEIQDEAVTGRPRGFIEYWHPRKCRCSAVNAICPEQLFESRHGKELKHPGKPQIQTTCSHDIRKADINIISEQLCSGCHSYERQQ